MDVFFFDVGFTTSRPVIPDEHVSRVAVCAPSLAQAMEWAALMVMRPAQPHLGLPAVQMPTSTRLVRVEV